MKASVALSALTMAVIAIAAPADIEARGGISSCQRGKKCCCDVDGNLNFLNCVSVL
ncbi:hypothetical protein BGZ61DRAFT_539783 [Ilyonectria robusta]|uniref:uncharacterized protein n=1 Tax=Ilyonectria robusta TaxID=1079257 RepID=UPI001E8CE194|nr:uncharacterized protein BGZ61DRAFT_539783 [Ilyonectria robusta]KAH8661132.1 hypothetical protein BGZ61DRAFT_539783 [Ilyonectria robusta]